MRRATARLGSLSLEILPFLWSTQLPTAVKTLVSPCHLKMAHWVREEADQMLVKLSRPHTTDFPQKVANRKGNGTPAISGKSRLMKYYLGCA